MDCWDLVVSVVEIGQFYWILQPGGLEDLIESVLSAAVDDAWTNYEHLDVLSLYCQHFILDLLDELVLRQRHSRLVVAVLVKGILDWFLLNFHFLL